MAEYQFKTDPMVHQLSEFENYRDHAARGLWWQMGSGKTKSVVDNAAYLFQRDEIDAVVVIAPDGVHSNWTETYETVKCQWETHAPDEVFRTTDLFTFHSTEAKTKKWERRAREFLTSQRKKIVAFSFAGVSTKNGRKLLDYLLKTHEVMTVVDEGHCIKNPDAKRTEEVWSIGDRSKYRRVLTGTLISQSMFDAYSPIRFLQKDYWEIHGLKSFWHFKQYFGIWETKKNYQQMRPKRVKQADGSFRVDMVPVEYQVLIDYKNKEELRWHIEQWGTRVRKSDVIKNLPPMTYEVLTVPLSKEQRKLYKSMDEEYMAELASGVVIETEHAMTKFQKMQQILQGFVIDEDGEYHRLKDCPRMEMLMEICEATDEQVLIWTPFPSDIEEIERRLRDAGKEVVSYYGDTDKKFQRKANAEAYQSSKAQFFVGNPAVGGTGLDLYNTGIMIYYGHTYSLIQREQSEERVPRPGLKKAWLKIDMVSTNTFEHKIMDAVETKQDIAKYLMRDYEKRLDHERGKNDRSKAVR